MNDMETWRDANGRGGWCTVCSLGSKIDSQVVQDSFHVTILEVKAFALMETSFITLLCACLLIKERARRSTSSQSLGRAPNGFVNSQSPAYAGGFEQEKTHQIEYIFD